MHCCELIYLRWKKIQVNDKNITTSVANLISSGRANPKLNMHYKLQRRMKGNGQKKLIISD